jgi:protein tyrosine/serine phosphatase
MKLLLSRSLLFLSLFTFLPLSAQEQKNSSPTISPLPIGQKLKLSGLPNAGKINDSLFRGAQPHTEGFEQLKSLGITTIVDLRGEDRALVEKERKLAESHGMRFVNIPVSGWSPPSNEQVAQFLSLFANHKEKIFVHCRFGDDRTGVFVAAYRMAHDQWPPEQAVREMYFFGFNGFWHPAMKAYIRDFPEKLKTAPALSPFASNKM